MHAKSNAEVAAVRSALELSNVTLLRNARRLSWKRMPMAQWSHRSARGSRGREGSLPRRHRRRVMRRREHGQALADVSQRQTPKCRGYRGEAVGSMNARAPGVEVGEANFRFERLRKAKSRRDGLGLRGGHHQGLALVTFPAASAIFTRPDGRRSCGFGA